MDTNSLSRDQCLALISKRGDRYGNNGGIHSLLEWCGKIRTPDVTLEEARLFLQSPKSDYSILQLNESSSSVPK